MSKAVGKEKVRFNCTVEHVEHLTQKMQKKRKRFEKEHGRRPWLPEEIFEAVSLLFWKLDQVLQRMHVYKFYILCLAHLYIFCTWTIQKP